MNDATVFDQRDGSATECALMDIVIAASPG
jgi:hypothetical protein